MERKHSGHNIFVSLHYFSPVPLATRAIERPKYLTHANNISREYQQELTTQETGCGYFLLHESSRRGIGRWHLVDTSLTFAVSAAEVPCISCISSEGVAEY